MSRRNGTSISADSGIRLALDLSRKTPVFAVLFSDSYFKHLADSLIISAKQLFLYSRTRNRGGEQLRQIAPVGFNGLPDCCLILLKKRKKIKIFVIVFKIGNMAL